MKILLKKLGAAMTEAGEPEESRRRCSEPSLSIVIDQPDHATLILSQLNLMRSDETSADTLLIAGGVELPCHRAVLAASSSYFRAMFHAELRESRERRIKFDGVTALALSRLIDFVYTGRIEVTVDDAQDLMAAASLFQYTTVVNTCCEFLLSHLHPNNCLGIEAFGRHHNCSQLADRARQFAINNFEAVAVESDEFLDLPAQRLESYISSNDIEVHMEEVVFEAVLRWINVDMGSRKTFACQLLRQIRFKAVPDSYIKSSILTHEVVAKCSSCTTFIADVKQSHALQPRPSTIAKEVMVVVGGQGMDGAVLNSVEMYNPSRDLWKPLPNIPDTLLHCAVATARNDIFVSGGIKDNTVISTVWRFSSDQQKWNATASMKSPRARHASAAIGSRLYVAGGVRKATGNVEGSVVDTIECLDVHDASRGWRVVVSSVPCPRFDSQMVAYGNKELVEVGGLQAGTGVVPTIEIYACCGDAGGDIAYSGEQFVLPDPVQHAQIAAVKGILYILWMDSSSVISLNAERRIFRRLAYLRQPRKDGGATVIGDHVYVTGGLSSGAPIETAEYYDNILDKWNDICPMLQARSCHGCVTIHMR